MYVEIWPKIYVERKINRLNATKTTEHITHWQPINGFSQILLLQLKIMKTLHDIKFD